MALGEAVRTITTMPVRYMTYPKGGPVLPSTPCTPPRHSAWAEALDLDAATLWGWGELRVPRHLWRALGRFAGWVEPALITEWLRLMRGYAAGQGRTLDLGVLATAMTWAEPSRDVARRVLWCCACSSVATSSTASGVAIASSHAST